MKQGSGNSSMGSVKREPIAHGVDVGGVSQIGCMVISNPEPLYEGRGYMAPSLAGDDRHPAGSQGKH